MPEDAVADSEMSRAGRDAMSRRLSGCDVTVITTVQ
jgi:hypothetical protein